MNCKLIILLTILGSLIWTDVLFAQTYNHDPYLPHLDPRITFSLFGDDYAIDTADISMMISLVDTADVHVSIAAGYFLAERGHSEIIPNLLNRYNISQYREMGAFEYVCALYLLRYPDVPDLAHHFIDTMLVYKHTGSGPFSELGLVLANKILLNFGDYSRFDALASVLDPNDPDPLVLNLMMRYRDRPNHRDSVFNTLRGLLTHPKESARQEAILLLGNYFPEEGETQSLLTEVIVNDDSPINKLVAVRLLKNSHDVQVIPGVFESLCISTLDTSIFESGLSWILEGALPGALLSAKRVAVARAAHTYFHGMAVSSLAHYVPPRPSPERGTMSMIDSLSSLQSEISSLGWLGDNAFVSELQNDLENARSYLSAGDSLNCAQQVKLFQQKVDEEYRDSLDGDNRFVTIEGWKFLYYNAQYILDRLPALPPSPTLTTLTPAMSLTSAGAFTLTVTGTNFTNNSVVKWNGTSRAIVFSSSSELQANILATDVAVVDSPQVTVLNPDGSVSSPLRYYVVSALPQPVRPVLECVVLNPDSSYTAWFGYKNDNAISVYIAVGAKNKFTPSPQNRGQTTVFQPGRQVRVFSIDFNGSNLVWTLNGRTSTASKNSSRCQ